MHHLGYDLPDRDGFAGLWSAIGDAPAGGGAPAPDPTRHPVATSTGARSPEVRAALAMFRSELAAQAAEDAAAA